MKKKSYTLGSWITLSNTSIAEIMAESGFDWLCIDMEHSSIDYNQAQQLILTIQSKGIKAYVRVGENNSRIIKRVLDSGADGIIVPNVKNINDAKKAIDAVIYPPKGKRGVGLARAQGYGFSFDNYMKNISKNIILIAQIEDIEAINNLDHIISLDGIDGTLIGPYDLSASLGEPGNFNNPLFQKAIENYNKIIKKYDKLNGYHVVPIDYKLVLDKIDSGFNFISFGFDANFLGSSIRNQLNKIL